MRFAGAFVGVVFVAVGCGAFGSDDDASGPPARLPDDSDRATATADGSASSSGGEATPLDASLETGATCSASTFCAPAASCVVKCSAGCASSPAECVTCAGGGPSAAVCVPDTYDVNGYLLSCAVDQRCACNAPEDCAGTSQVCLGGKCFACGEKGTTGEPCANGRSCDASKTCK